MRQVLWESHAPRRPVLSGGAESVRLTDKGLTISIARAEMQARSLLRRVEPDRFRPGGGKHSIQGRHCGLLHRPVLDRHAYPPQQCRNDQFDSDGGHGGSGVGPSRVGGRSRRAKPRVSDRRLRAVCRPCSVSWKFAGKELFNLEIFAMPNDDTCRERVHFYALYPAPHACSPPKGVEEPSITASVRKAQSQARRRAVGDMGRKISRHGLDESSRILVPQSLPTADVISMTARRETAARPRLDHQVCGAAAGEILFRGR